MCYNKITSTKSWLVPNRFNRCVWCFMQYFSQTFELCVWIHNFASKSVRICVLAPLVSRFLLHRLVSRSLIQYTRFSNFGQLVRETHTHTHARTCCAMPAVTFFRSAIFHWLVASVIIFSLVCAQYSHLSNKSTEIFCFFFFSILFRVCVWVCESNPQNRTPQCKKNLFLLPTEEKRRKKMNTKYTQEPDYMVWAFKRENCTHPYVHLHKMSRVALFKSIELA